MTDEQQKDAEAAMELRRGLYHGIGLTIPAYKDAQSRAISALEARAKAPQMRQISRQEVAAVVCGSGSRVKHYTERQWVDTFCNLLCDHSLLAEPASEPHPLDALKFTHAPLVNWNQVADKINALIDYLKQQEDKQP